MNLVNSRGMDENLYHFCDNTRQDLSKLTKAFMLSQFASHIPEDKIIEGQFRVKHVGDDQHVVEKMKKDKWEHFFTLSEKHNLATTVGQAFFNSKDITYSHEHISDSKINAFMKAFMPDWEKRLKDVTEPMVVMVLNKEPGMQNYNDTFAKEIPLLFEYASKHTKKDRHVYNDLDNSFYKQKDTVFLHNQNYHYELTFKDNIYTITVLEKGNSPDECLNVKFNFDMDETNEYRLVIDEFDQPFVLSHFMLDLEYAIKSYQEDHDIKEEINPVVKTYDYHLAYMHRNYHLTHEEILWRMVFYCFPAGNDDKGNYEYDSRDNLPYQKLSEKAMKNIRETITHGNITIPVTYHNNDIFKSIKKVNEDWQVFFKDAHNFVSKFLEQYKNANTQEKMVLSYVEPKEQKEFIEELEEFLLISESLSQGVPYKATKITKARKKNI